jgi:hypothetical protein
VTAAAPPSVGPALLGLTALASAGICGLLAEDHVILRGAICGGARITHCGWCFGATGLAVAGLAALAAAIRATT